LETHLVPENDNHLFMASSSDNFIKIWSLKELAEEDPEESPGELKLTPRVFKVGKGSRKLENLPINLPYDEIDLSVSVKLESTLSCHEIVHSIYWHPSQNEFLSSGANSVVRWKYSEDEEHVWLPVSRLGEMHEERNDYYDGIYSPDGTSFLCHSLYGALLLWKIQDGQVSEHPAALIE
jgi:WD40 repeat protein